MSRGHKIDHCDRFIKIYIQVPGPSTRHFLSSAVECDSHNLSHTKLSFHIQKWSDTNYTRVRREKPLRCPRATALSQQVTAVTPTVTPAVTHAPPPTYPRLPPALYQPVALREWEEDVWPLPQDTEGEVGGDAEGAGLLERDGEGEAVMEVAQQEGGEIVACQARRWKGRTRKGEEGRGWGGTGCLK